MAIIVHIEKKDLWLLAAIMVFLVGVGYVIAYNPNWGTNPGDYTIHGHSGDEVEGRGPKGPIGGKGPIGDKGPRGDKGPKGDPGGTTTVETCLDSSGKAFSLGGKCKQGATCNLGGGNRECTCGVGGWSCTTDGIYPCPTSSC